MFPSTVPFEERVAVRNHDDAFCLLHGRWHHTSHDRRRESLALLHVEAQRQTRGLVGTGPGKTALNGRTVLGAKREGRHGRIHAVQQGL